MVVTLVNLTRSNDHETEFLVKALGPLLKVCVTPRLKKRVSQRYITHSRKHFTFMLLYGSTKYGRQTNFFSLTSRNIKQANFMVTPYFTSCSFGNKLRPI